MNEILAHLCLQKKNDRNQIHDGIEQIYVRILTSFGPAISMHRKREVYRNPPFPESASFCFPPCPTREAKEIHHFRNPPHFTSAFSHHHSVSIIPSRCRRYPRAAGWGNNRSSQRSTCTKVLPFVRGAAQEPLATLTAHAWPAYRQRAGSMRPLG